MNEQFRTEADRFFSERHSSILIRFRTENTKNTEFLERLTQLKLKIKSLVTDEAWQEINGYIDLMNIHRDIQSKYLYGQGIKDCVSLSHFLDSDFANDDFEEIVWNSNDSEGVVYYGRGKKNSDKGIIID